MMIPISCEIDGAKEALADRQHNRPFSIYPRVMERYIIPISELATTNISALKDSVARAYVRGKGI